MGHFLERIQLPFAFRFLMGAELSLEAGEVAHAAVPSPGTVRGGHNKRPSAAAGWGEKEVTLTLNGAHGMVSPTAGKAGAVLGAETGPARRWGADLWRWRVAAGRTLGFDLGATFLNIGKLPCI